ncbi:MAG: DUF438 domain-containing protein [Promethearchaeota archaeon]
MKYAITKATKVAELLKKYPFLLETLVGYDPKLSRLKNPILRRVVGRRATLTDVAQMIGSDLSDLARAIANSIEFNTDDEVDLELGEEGRSGWASDQERRQDFMKSLVLELHEGGDKEVLKERFREVLGDVDPAEIAKMEQSLIDSGELTAEEITLLCDLHVGIFEDALAKKQDPTQTPGHPVHTYAQENERARELAEAYRAGDAEALERLKQIEVHYTRLENQLFPALEKAGFTGPSNVMWAKHDEVREMMRSGVSPGATGDAFVKAVEDLIVKEEKILFPTALDMLSTTDWVRVRDGEEEIGFAFGVVPGTEWKPVTPGDVHAHEALTKPEHFPPPETRLQLRTGVLTLEQVDLMLRHLPVDVTYINEEDEVLYFSDTKDRLFPRSKGIIGRKVQNCHPRKSLDRVNRIIEAFRSGERDAAEFWIRVQGRFVYIRYFAVRDDDGIYRGTLEVTQDVGPIQQLTGERRLLDWY